MHRITFDSPFYFGDLVEFDSRHNGSGRGRVTDIVIGSDRSVYYIIDVGESGLIGGILPAERRLVEASGSAGRGGE
jgi:hypothetical protein